MTHLHSIKMTADGFATILQYKPNESPYKDWIVFEMSIFNPMEICADIVSMYYKEKKI